LPRYPEYKDSGVDWLGEVPWHWDVRRLKQACNVFPSNVDKKSHDGETPVNLCNYTDVYYNESITADMDFMAATASTDQIAKFTLRAGDTIITKDSETADDIAIGAYVPADLPGVICGYHLSMVRPMADTSGAFIKRLFDSTYVKSCVAVRANGLTRVGLGQYEIDNLELPFPPIGEQTQIAAFLDRETGKIDALIAEQQRLVELLAEKRQAVISHAVTKGLNPNAPMKDSGIEWLGEVPAHWNVCGLKRYCDVRDGTHDTPAFVDPDVDTAPMVTSKDLVNGEVVFEDAKHISMADCFEIAKRSGVAIGDLLMPMIGSIGGAVIVETEQVFAIKNIALFKNSKHHHNHWLKYVLNSDLANYQFELSRSGGVQGFVGLSTLRNLTFAFPSIDEQQIIATFLDSETAKFDTLTAEANRAIALLQERRSALISAAVTGKIDVRNT